MLVRGVTCYFRIWLSAQGPGHRCVSPKADVIRAVVSVVVSRQFLDFVLPSGGERADMGGMEDPRKARVTTDLSAGVYVMGQ